MDTINAISDAPIQTTISAIFFSMELSRSKWLIMSLSPGSGERMSKHVMTAGDVSGLLERLDAIRSKAEARAGRAFPFAMVVVSTPEEEDRRRNSRERKSLV